jgi:molecular chaperone DnaK (HSP70)
MFRRIIPRQTSYPCRNGFLGSTGYPYQPAVKMRVFRGEDPDPLKNAYLGEIELPISPPQETLVPVGAIFELDANGIIHFTAVQFPISQKLIPLLEYAGKNDGALDLTAVDNMLKYGDAKSKTVHIKVTT